MDKISEFVLRFHEMIYGTCEKAGRKWQEVLIVEEGESDDRQYEKDGSIRGCAMH